LKRSKITQVTPLIAAPTAGLYISGDRKTKVANQAPILWMGNLTARPYPPPWFFVWLSILSTYLIDTLFCAHYIISRFYCFGDWIMSEMGLWTIFILAMVGMSIAIFGVFPPQVDFPEHEDPPEEAE
jgi:hypothetical protein